MRDAAIELEKLREENAKLRALIDALIAELKELRDYIANA